MKLQGRVAIVTGAASGMGRAIALRYGQEGARVVVADVNVPEAEHTVNQVRQAGGTALAVQADVRSREQVQALVDRTVQELGGLDVLVNNAGVDKIIPFLETPEED